MNSARAFLTAGLVVVFGSGFGRAGSEARLLDKFEKDNRTAAQTLKDEIISALAQAEGLRGAEPSKAAALLERAAAKLDKDVLLPPSERTALDRKLRAELTAARDLAHVREGDAKKRLTEMARREAGVKSEPPEAMSGSAGPSSLFAYAGAGSGLGRPGPLPARIDPPIRPFMSPPFFFTPNITAVPIFNSLQVAPVVTGDRRYVRMNLNANFMVPKITYAPTTLVTPQVFHGYKGNIVLPIFEVKNYWFVAP